MKKVLLSLGLFICVFHSVQGQYYDNIKINKQYAGKHLLNIIKDLEKSHDLNIDYNEDDIPNGIIGSKFFYDANLDKVFGTILKNTNLQYKILEEEIIIRNKNTEIKKKEKVYVSRTNFNLSGKIKDYETGESLPFAQIVVSKTTNGTSSNVDGYFTIFNVPSDTSVLEITYLGYERKRYHLTPKKASREITIELHPESKQIEEVLIVGETDEVLKMSDKISMVSLSPQKIGELPSLGEKDIFRSFQLLPGISGSNESSSGLYIRGGTPDQNLILYDGFTVYHVDHLFGMFSAFNSNAIKDVKLSKGGFESKYGGRLSSVMEITGKDGNEKEFNAGGGIGFLSFNAFAEIPLNNKGSILINGRKSFQSFLYNNIFESFNSTDDNQQTQMKPGGETGGRMGRTMQSIEPTSYFYDLNAKITYRPTTKDILSYSFYNGQDNLDNSRDMSMSRGNFTVSGGSTDLTKWGNWGNSLKWSRKWNDYVYTNNLLSFSQYYSERDMTRSSTIYREDETIERNMGTIEENILQDLTFKTDNEWKVNQYNQIEFGLQATNYNIDYDFVRNDTITIQNRNDVGSLISLYLQDKIEYKKLTLTPGIRSSYYSVTGKPYVEPRFSMSYDITSRLKFKGAVGEYYQFAKRIIRDDIESGSRDFWMLADDEVVPVGSSIHYIAGLQYETKNYVFDTEVFYKTLNGLSEYTLLFAPSFMNVNFDEFFYEGEGYSKGIEFLVQKKFGLYNGWISYTLSDVNYKFPVYGENWFPASHDVTHEFKYVNSYKWKNWTFAATWIYATGKPYTAPVGGYEITMADGSVKDFITIGEKNGFRLPDYHRMDLSASFEFPFAQKGFGNLSFSLFNVYNRKNVWYKEFEIIEGELIETDVNTLGITPNITLSIKLK
jgi:ferric enterobactin receptor